MKSKLIIIVLAVIALYKFVIAKQIGADVRKQVQGIKAQHPDLAYIPEGLVVSIAMVESNLNPDATGAAGEYGYMQIMPDTWAWIGEYYNVGLPASAAYNPYYNIYAGMLYMDYLYKTFGSWFAVIHAYNVGPSGYQQGKRNNVYFSEVLGSWSIS